MSVHLPCLYDLASLVLVASLVTTAYPVVSPPFHQAIELGPQVDDDKAADQVFAFSSDDETGDSPVAFSNAETDGDAALRREAEMQHRRALEERIDELEGSNLAALKKITEAKEEIEWYDEALQVRHVPLGIRLDHCIRTAFS